MKELWLTMMWIVIVLLLYVHFLGGEVRNTVKNEFKHFEKLFNKWDLFQTQKYAFLSILQILFKMTSLEALFFIDPIVSTAFSFYMINFSLFPFKTKEEQID